MASDMHFPRVDEGFFYIVAVRHVDGFFQYAAATAHHDFLVDIDPVEDGVNLALSIVGFKDLRQFHHVARVVHHDLAAQRIEQVIGTFHFAREGHFDAVGFALQLLGDFLGVAGVSDIGDPHGHHEQHAEHRRRQQGKITRERWLRPVIFHDANVI
jgi:hypothetical protein